MLGNLLFSGMANRQPRKRAAKRINECGLACLARSHELRFVVDVHFRDELKLKLSAIEGVA